MKSIVRDKKRPEFNSISPISETLFLEVIVCVAGPQFVPD